MCSLLETKSSRATLKGPGASRNLHLKNIQPTWHGVCIFRMRISVTTSANIRSNVHHRRFSPVASGVVNAQNTQTPVPGWQKQRPHPGFQA